ncbi:hypothetical protein B0H13DRAFT_1906532 [Mycena leptocephala]|nr:hypothetical protein B0H13DRAFT_1906532 [Mycena leptocephala]
MYSVLASVCEGMRQHGQRGWRQRFLQLSPVSPGAGRYGRERVGIGVEAEGTGRAWQRRARWRSQTASTQAAGGVRGTSSHDAAPREGGGGGGGGGGGHLRTVDDMASALSAQRWASIYEAGRTDGASCVGHRSHRDQEGACCTRMGLDQEIGGVDVEKGDMDIDTVRLHGPRAHT